MITTAEHKAPYPQPYNDEALLVKELIHGVLPDAMAASLRAGDSPLRRYGQLDDVWRIKERIAKGSMSPYDYDTDIIIWDLPRVRQVAWLPYIIEVIRKGEPKKIYDPRRYYNALRYQKIRIDYDMPDFEGRAQTDYYDPINPGIHGIFTDGNAHFVGFFSLLTMRFYRLGNIPSDIDVTRCESVEYVRGAILYRCDGTYLSFDFQGGVHRLDGKGDAIALADFERIVIEDGGGYAAYDARLTPTGEVFGDVRPMATAYRHNPYGAGAKIGDAIYLPKKDGAWRWIRGKRLKVKPVSTPLWRYNKRTLYDYCSDGFERSDKIGCMRYNLKRYGVLAPKTRYPSKATYKSPDIYGEFVDTDDGVYHTYDFRHWRKLEEVDTMHTFRARIWVRGRSDNIVAFFPKRMQYDNYKKENVIDPSKNGTFIFEGCTLERR